MLIPIGPVKNIPITILRVSHDPPQVLQGNIIYFDGKAYQVTYQDDTLAFQEGEQLLVDFGEGSAGRRRTRVKTVAPAVVTLELLGRPRRRERREFPRIEGQVNLQYQLVAPEDRARFDAWLEHPHLIEVGPAWLSPDPFMDFSATGLKFRTHHDTEPGRLLCLRFQLPGISPETFTCGGEVVRSELEEEGVWSWAVAFVGLGEKTLDALMEYTRHCQDILLGIDSLHEE